MKTALLLFGTVALTCSTTKASLITVDPASNYWHVFGTWVADREQNQVSIHVPTDGGFLDLIISGGPPPGPNSGLPDEFWDFLIGRNLLVNDPPVPENFAHYHLYPGGSINGLNGATNPEHNGHLDILEYTIVHTQDDTFSGTFDFHTIPEGGPGLAMLALLGGATAVARRRG